MDTTDRDSRESIREEHAAIRNTLATIEKTVNEYPGPGAARSWLEEVQTGLDRLQGMLLHHFKYEERSGMFDEIRETWPAAANQCRTLLGDHDRLLRRLEEIRRDLAARRETGGSAGGLGELVTAWIRDLADHEGRENELLFDSIEGGPPAQD